MAFEHEQNQESHDNIQVDREIPVITNFLIQDIGMNQLEKKNQFGIQGCSGV